MGTEAMNEIVDALACYRLTRLVTTDEITRGLRRRAIEHLPITCDWCVGVWVAFGVVAVRRIVPRVWAPVATALALSAVTGLLAENV